MGFARRQGQRLDMGAVFLVFLLLKK